MKTIKIFDINNKIDSNDNNWWIKLKTIINNYIIYFIILLNAFINIYLLIENRNKSYIIKEILDFKNTFYYKNNSFKNVFPHNDKELIGLNYPTINYEEIKDRLKNYNILASLIDLINQLEVKLIFLEKEINITKLVSFYSSRKDYLKDFKVDYDEKKIKELHEIINWIVIHKSNQLKGIASDKYLACKYVELKLNKNLCEHRITSYNKYEDLNYKELSKYGNIVLKVSNSCFKTLFIHKNTGKGVFKKLMGEFRKKLGFYHGLVDSQYYHLYAKKRILVEKMFLPLNDLYEFRYYIVNNNIKFIYLRIKRDNKVKIFIYDKNYNFIFKEKTIDIEPINIHSMFKKDILKQLYSYAIKLSEDFPNFVRVDLNVFHDKIYLSEITFCSSNGLPRFRNSTFVKESVENFLLHDDYY